METVTLRPKENSRLLLADDGKNKGIVVHRLSDMTELGYQYIKNSRGKWVLLNQ